MAFSVNTNLGALQAYNALAKVNAETQKAQLRLATTKRINSVADDTSGFNIGKQMEASVLKQKAQLNNVSSAKNLLATAESALQQINDKLNQISAKYTDAQDPLKDQASIAKDITTLAVEIKSILQTTNINGTKLLVKQTDVNLAATDKSLDVGGAAFSVDFGGKMDTVNLLTKIASLTLADASGTTAGETAAGLAAARAFVVGGFLTDVNTKLSESNVSAANVTAFADALTARYDSDIAAGLSVSTALDNAFTAGKTAVGGTTVADALAQGVQSTGTVTYDDAAALTAVNTGYTNATAAKTAANSLMANIATKLGEYGVSAAQVQAFSTAFGGFMATQTDAANFDTGAHSLTAVTAALAAGAAALTVAVGGDANQALIDAATASGVQSTGTAAFSYISQQADLTTAYDGGVAGYVPSANDTASVITAAQDVSVASAAIRDSLGRIGNLSQSIDSRSEFLTSSIANSTASISSIFDADMAAEQLNATKGNISGQIGTAMLSQLNSAPQQLLSLFR
ncbi:MAG: flagellin [Ignavibacteriales bacterium]|nr:flagellin [Ignavibacteriales bacterium]